MLPTEKPGLHYQGDIFDIINDGLDMMIAHPPCTFLTVARNRYYHPKYDTKFPTQHKDREDAIWFFEKLLSSNIPKICIENPIGIMSRLSGKPAQIIQPYQFGDSERKATCLWLKGLPKLIPTNIVKPEIIYHKSGRTDGKLHFETLKLPKAERAKARSKTFQGIADAMADQWIPYLTS